MKFINIILLLIFFANVYSQDHHPNSMSFTYDGTEININQERFKQKNFITGWQ